jgi:hypothetical protein
MMFNILMKYIREYGALGCCGKLALKSTDNNINVE